MRLEEAFSLVVNIEAQELANDLNWRSMNMWPLIRQCLWLELTQTVELAQKVPPAVGAPQFHQRIINRIRAAVRALLSHPPSAGPETTAFISRPVYLQRLPNGNLFDRIVDPLVLSMPGVARHEKYYVAPWPYRERLQYSAALLRPARNRSLEFPNDHRTGLLRVAIAAGIAPEKLLKRYGESLKAFDRWYEAGRNFFDSRKSLKTVYLTGWYFPDMMGIIAAAQERGIKTIDLQHGKQGKLQAMYSGWRIPDYGYQLMPNVFWCWGKPSAEHILARSPDRNTHLPIVGGYPWLDYYRRHISSAASSAREGTRKFVLVTIQPRQGDNVEPVPDFLLEFLREKPEGMYFVFRCHPNDRNGPTYCRRRLYEFPHDIYDIDDGRSNLFDMMISSSHHITAYSSCCYEASAFGVPTLLFGADARTIYSDEIETGVFSWTPGSTRDLALWLETSKSDTGALGSAYIFSSLEHAAAIVGSAEYLDPDRREMKERSNA